MARRYSMIASLTLFSARCFSPFAKASRAVAWGALLHAMRAAKSRARPGSEVRLFIFFFLLSRNPVRLSSVREGAIMRRRVQDGLPAGLRQMTSAGLTFSGDAGTSLTRRCLELCYADLRRARNAASKPVPSSIMVVGSGTAVVTRLERSELMMLPSALV